jgi:homoserine O-acetyltransferase
VNCIGGCKGSTGPLSVDPRTGCRFGGFFPELTLGDIVRAQRLVVRHLGIAKLHAVVGGSMGGMQALLWCADYPREVGRIAVLAAGLSQSPMAIALNAVSRACVEKDPYFRGGHYEPGEGPATGLAVGRMLAHISYLSSAAFDQKFGRAKVPGAQPGDPVHWQVENYLNHQGEAFVKRFDANTYLLMTKSLDYFDPAAHAPEHSLSKALHATNAEFLVISFSSDWRFSPARSREIVRALLDADRDVSYVEIESEQGHDSFLLDVPLYHRVLRTYFDKIAASGASA